MLETEALTLKDRISTLEEEGCILKMVLQCHEQKKREREEEKRINDTVSNALENDCKKRIIEEEERVSKAIVTALEKERKPCILM